MRLTIGLDFDGGAWPPLAGEAAAGEAVEGPNGLLRRVETALGLSEPELSQLDRLAALVPIIETMTSCYYSASAKVDAFATARRLLSDRDELLFSGWALQPISPRLAELASLSRQMKPGLPDRLHNAIEALARRRADIESVALVEPESAWPLLWRRLFEALRARGTQVHYEEPKKAAPSGDLLHAGKRDFSPEGDGSLLLLRGTGPLETADEVAAYLASLDRGTTVVITPDTVLDGALARHGLPTTGAPERPLDSTALHLLPLVLELLWNPPDPAAVHQLLSLPLSPIPSSLRGRLQGALERWPAVGSLEWDKTYGEWLDDLPKLEKDEKRRERGIERASLLLTPAAAEKGQDKVPIAKVLEHLDALGRWVRGLLNVAKDGMSFEAPRDARPSTALGMSGGESLGTSERASQGMSGSSEEHAVSKEEPFEPGTDWSVALTQIERMRSLLKVHGDRPIDRVRLRKLLELATDGLAVPGRRPAQAGIDVVSAPGAIAGPADTVVWWNFDRDHSPPVRVLTLTKAEREALEKVGVELPSAGERAIEAANAWHRPLVSAAKRLILCCPRHDEVGESQAVHALWDEIEASISRTDHSAHVAKLVCNQAPEPVQRTQRTLRATPKPHKKWEIVGQALGPRKAEKGESPSSLESLVACSFKWAAQYAAALYEHPTSGIKIDARVLGNLAHDVIEHVLKDLPPTLEAAREKAATYFDEMGPRLVAQLFQAGHDLQRTEAKRVICAAAAGLARFVLESGHAVKGVEEKLGRDAGGWIISGRLDVQLDPPAVIDLKFGGRTRKRKALENGTATQLATYAYLLGNGAPPWPPVAYFIVKDQSLYSTEADRLGKGALRVDGASPQNTWNAFRAAIEQRWKELRGGSLDAPAASYETSRSKLDDGEIHLEAPCQYCQFDALCGRAFGESK